MIATEDDLPKIVTLGKRFHESANPGGVFCPGVFWDFCLRLIVLDTGNIFLSRDGMLGALIAPLPWDNTYKVAREAFWWSEDGHGRALVGEYEEWARPISDEGRMGFLENMKPLAVMRLLSRMGYEIKETEMVKKW